MENKKITEKIEELNLFFDSVGFDEKTKDDHIQRIMKIIIASVSIKLDQTNTQKNEVEISEIKSPEDFYAYYEKYIDRSTIDKIIEEESYKAFSEYFKVISDQISN